MTISTHKAIVFIIVLGCSQSKRSSSRSSDKGQSGESFGGVCDNEHALPAFCNWNSTVPQTPKAYDLELALMLQSKVAVCLLKLPLQLLLLPITRALRTKLSPCLPL